MPFEITALAGNLTGTLNANAATQKTTLSARGTRLNLNGFRPLNKHLKNVVLDSTFALTTSGATTQALIKGLYGQIVAQTNQGEIVSELFTDLAKMLNVNRKKQNVAFSNTDSRIFINCAANLQIKDGVITGNDQMALETNTLDITAGGSIHLAQKLVNISLRPSLSNPAQSSDLLSLAEYIRITGTFDKLTPSVDTQKAATNLLQAGLEKLAGTEQVATEPQQKQTGKLCQNVLGKYALMEEKQSTKQPTTKQAQQKQPTNNAPTKQQFQQQLLNSFLQALTPNDNTTH